MLPHFRDPAGASRGVFRLQTLVSLHILTKDESDFGGGHIKVEQASVAKRQGLGEGQTAEYA